LRVAPRLPETVQPLGNTGVLAAAKK